MQHIDEISERIHASFENQTAVRDRILSQARTLTRYCANAIRAAHRDERPLAASHLEEARRLAESLHTIRDQYPDLYYAGYTQDALKEFVEASIVFSLLQSPNLPEPDALNVEYATYLQGLAEAVGELRRRCLDMLLQDKPEEAERLLGYMDEIFAILVTMDFPDAITGGLRRLTDIARSLIERTRGDLTISLRQKKLETSIHRLEERLDLLAPSE